MKQAALQPEPLLKSEGDGVIHGLFRKSHRERSLACNLFGDFQRSVHRIARSNDEQSEG
jgi:hypothetical protein